MKRNTFFKLFSILIVSFLVSFTFQRIFHVGISDLQSWVESFGLFSSGIYVALLFLGLSVPFNPVSDYLVVNLAAFLFDPRVAILATFVAHSLALTANYWISRRFGWNILSKLLSEGEDVKLRELSKKITSAQVFWLRWLLPLTAIGVDVVSYASGLAKLPFSKFFLASIIPWTLINILFFSFTKFVINRESLLFFIPGAVIVVTPLVIYFWIKNAARIKLEAGKHVGNFSKLVSKEK